MGPCINFFVDDETDVLASTYTSTDGFTSRHFVDPNSGYSYTTNNNIDGPPIRLFMMDQTKVIPKL